MQHPMRAPLLWITTCGWPLLLALPGIAVSTVALAGGAAGPLVRAAERQFVIPAGREARAIALLDDIGFERNQPGGLTWDSIAIARDQLVFSLHRTAAPTATPLASITARHRDLAQPGDRIGRELALQVHIIQALPTVTQAVEAAVQSILHHDAGGFFLLVGEPTMWPVVQLAAALLAVWLAGLLVWTARHKAWRHIEFRFKLTHLLPAVLQAVLYGYWSSQVPEVAQQLPAIVAQIAYAYALDFLLGMSLKKRWDFTFGPLPIVLSANLFVWFRPGSLHLSFVVVTTAMASKWLLQRNGRHIFNPSALGVALVGAACLSMPEWLRFSDIAHLLAVPSYMLLVVAAIGLVAQSRVPIVLITLAAALVLVGLKAVGAYHTVYPFWPAVLLALTLLATDPATIPHNGFGRLLFGMATGLLIWATSAALAWAGESDFFGKVLPIPLLNLAVPLFDRAGNWLAAQLRSLPGRLGGIAQVCDPTYNWGHIALWVVIVGPQVV